MTRVLPSPSPAGVPQAMVWMLLVGLLFGNSIGYSYGLYSEPAMAMVLMGLTALMARWWTQVRGSDRPLPDVNVAPLFWCGLFTMALYALVDSDPFPYAIAPLELGRYGRIGFLLTLLTYLPFLHARRPEPQWLRLARLATLTLMLAATAHDVVRTSPRPKIDVWTVQQAGAEALVGGKNPYEAVAVQDSGPAARFVVPYVYPPTQALLTVPAWVLTGDVRYTMVLALLVAGWLLRAIVHRSGRRFPSIVEDAPTLLVWTMPKLSFVIVQSWVDPVQFMLIVGAALAAAARRPTLVAVLFGLVLTAKQTMFWTVGLAGVLLQFNRRQWIITAAVGAASVLPFAIADFSRLKYGMFDIVRALPDRPDALTINNWGLQHFGVMFPSVLAFPLAALVAASSAWRMPRTLQHWALSSVATYAVFFAFNKWAFANYYFLIASLAALGAACATHDKEILVNPPG